MGKRTKPAGKPTEQASTEVKPANEIWREKSEAAAGTLLDRLNAYEGIEAKRIFSEVRKAGQVLAEFGLDLRDAVAGIPAAMAADATPDVLRALRIWQRAIVFGKHLEKDPREEAIAPHRETLLKAIFEKA